MLNNMEIYLMIPKMYISTEIASIFPVPILYTPIQNINDIYILL